MFYICSIIQKKLGVGFMVKKMGYTFVVLFVLGSFVKAQRHEIGVQLGISNLVGDIGRTNYVFQPIISGNFSQFGLPFYGGILYRMNFNPYQTLRFNLGYSHIQFSDGTAQEDYRRQRGLSGTNNIIEADVLFEYYFFPVNDEQKGMLSPYVFGGLGAMLKETPQLTINNEFKRDARGAAIAPENSQDFNTVYTFSAVRKMTMSIPFGVGLKYKFNYNWAVFGEFMFRPTFSDTIDYSVIGNKDVKITYDKEIKDGTKSLLQTSPYIEEAKFRADKILKNRQTGNPNSKDWVNTVSIGLTYSFGRPPCYCEY